MAPDSQLRAGIVGFGFAGRIFHAPFLAAAGFDVAGICTGNPERAAQARAEYPGAEIVADAEQLIGREDLDLIVIATPNSSHTELACAALEAGHDVVVDKPFAPTVAEAERIIATAADTGGVLSVFQSRRFDSDFRTVREVLGSGELGAVHRFESRYERWRPAVGQNWRESDDPALAGGLLFDLGSHLVDQFINLFGAPDQVYAEVKRRRPGALVDDDVFLALQAGSVTGHLWMSALAADPGPRFRVLGDRAAFSKSGMDPQEDALLAGDRPGAADWGTEPAATHGRIGNPEGWRPVVSARGDYTDYYRSFAEAMSGVAPVPVDPADSLLGLRVLHAAKRSAALGTVESLA
ncbi:Gfo/Idh/MocA family oxidoreductase [soil metagenome]